METTDSVLEAIYQDSSDDDDEEGEAAAQDVEMLDAVATPHAVSATPAAARGGGAPARSPWHGPKKKKNKRKKKKKSGSGADTITDINRFVMDTCRRLREKKPYLVWNAVGCLGVSALSDLVKEVEIIQDCGGQMTADGSRFRTGGGILWNILKSRDPKVYNEIMAKGKEFEVLERNDKVSGVDEVCFQRLCCLFEMVHRYEEQHRDDAVIYMQKKQFQEPKRRRTANQNPEKVTQSSHASENISAGDISDGSEHVPEVSHGHEPSESKIERVSALNRIRVPVAYDDLYEEGEIRESTEKGELHESTEIYSI